MRSRFALHHRLHTHPADSPSSSDAARGGVVIALDVHAHLAPVLPERLGDIVVVSTKHKVLGTSASKHDLSGLTEPLRYTSITPSQRDYR